MPEATRTPFAGLTRIPPGNSLGEDNFAFQDLDPLLIDHLLKIGAITHRHDEHAALANPATLPVLASKATGGLIGAHVTINVAYTLMDPEGGETLPSPLVALTTPEPFPDPQEPPTAVVSNAAGVLPAANYTYGLTLTDGKGGESALSPLVEVVVEVGFAKSEVTLGLLKKIMEESGGTEWRLWRMQDGGSWNLIAHGVTEEIKDDGTLVADCTVIPPPASTIAATNTLEVEVPVHAGAPFFRVYATTTGAFDAASLLGEYLAAEMAKVIAYPALALKDGTPPVISRAFGGAVKIDPDTMMINFPWKRPVANLAALPAEGNESGDVRETLDTHHLYSWDEGAKAWVEISGGGGLSWKGAWAGGAEYVKGDAVEEGGSSYISLKAANKGHKPSELGEWWGLVAKTGEKGTAGEPGEKGTTGTAGAGILHGIGVPAEELGINEDFYIDTAAKEIYGPKAAGKWGAGTPLASGPEGPKGEMTWRGPWVEGTEYAKGDAVEEGGSTYVSIKAANKAHKPSALGEWWQLVAAGGGGGGTQHASYIATEQTPTAEEGKPPALLVTPDTVAFVLSEARMVSIFAAAGLASPAAGFCKVFLFIDGAVALNENGKAITGTGPTGAFQRLMLSIAPPAGTKAEEEEGVKFRAYEKAVGNTTLGGESFSVWLSSGEHTVELRFTGLEQKVKERRLVVIA